jgi:hypothetical protein
MALPQERGTFTPFQKTPFRPTFRDDILTRDISAFRSLSGPFRARSNSNSEPSSNSNNSNTSNMYPNTMTSTLNSRSSEIKSPETIETSLGTSGDIVDSERSHLVKSSKLDYRSSQSYSSNSSFSALISPPIQSISPTLGIQTPTKNSYVLGEFKPNEEPEPDLESEVGVRLGGGQSEEGDESSTSTIRTSTGVILISSHIFTCKFKYFTVFICHFL